MKVFFQSVGTLFSYNLGLTSQLASSSDFKVTIATRSLLLYVYGIWYTKHYENSRILLYTFPTFAPQKYTLLFGWHISKLLVRSTLCEKFISKFDVVHLNDRGLLTNAAVNLEKPTVFTLHWHPSEIDKDICSKVGAIVTPSKTMSRIVEEHLGRQPTVVYNGVDPSLFNAQMPTKKAREFLGLPYDRKVILWNGRLDSIKDPRTLIDSIPIVAKEIPNSLFIIKGRTVRSNILQYAKKHLKNTGTTQNVKMIVKWDFITKMPYYYRSADVCVHTSLSECCSLVLIEAMACGIPIIVTDIPTVYDPVGNAGLHFEPRNSEDLAEKIIRILRDEKLGIKLQEKGFRRISELGLTWKEASERYKNLYLSLM